MIDAELLKRGIVQHLKSDTTVTSLLSGTSQIKESNYQGQDFVYPAIRIDVQPQIPLGTGTDRVRLSRSLWIIRVYSEDKSSAPANRLLSAVISSLFDSQIHGTNENNIPNFVLIRINLITSDDAFRISDRLWMATATFESEGNLLNPP